MKISLNLNSLLESLKLVYIPENTCLTPPKEKSTRGRPKRVNFNYGVTPNHLTPYSNTSIEMDNGEIVSESTVLNTNNAEKVLCATPKLTKWDYEELARRKLKSAPAVLIKTLWFQGKTDAQIVRHPQVSYKLKTIQNYLAAFNKALRLEQEAFYSQNQA